MKALEEKILAEGKVLPGDVLLVGSFLNQRIDVTFLMEMGKEIASLFGGMGITKILTVESSGIALAVAAGAAMALPAVFAKKHRSSNVPGGVYTAPIHSYTHGTDFTAVVSSEYLLPGDVVLIVDDFLASGEAIRGLMRLCEKAGCRVAGAAVAIEKRYQGGGEGLRSSGLRVEALASISRMTADGVEFC